MRGSFSYGEHHSLGGVDDDDGQRCEIQLAEEQTPVDFSTGGSIAASHHVYVTLVNPTIVGEDNIFYK